MPRTLRWPLAIAWALSGAAAGIALAHPFTRWALLLVPTALVAVWLIWQFDRHREIGAALIGLVSWPLLVIRQVQDPPCLVGGDSSCAAGAIWPWAVLAALLLIGGLVTLLAPTARRVAH